MTRSGVRTLHRTVLLLSIFVYSVTGSACRTRDKAVEKVGENRPLVLADLDYGPGEYSPRREEPRAVYATQINDTLIYPVQSGRAEDHAPAIEAILQARYGSGAQVITHEATNKLLIHIPPYDIEKVRERQHSGRMRARRDRSVVEASGRSRQR